MNQSPQGPNNLNIPVLPQASEQFRDLVLGNPQSRQSIDRAAAGRPNVILEVKIVFF